MRGLAGTTAKKLIYVGGLHAKEDMNVDLGSRLSVGTWSLLAFAGDLPHGRRNVSFRQPVPFLDR